MDISKGLFDFTVVVIVTVGAVAPRAVKAYRSWRDLKRSLRIGA